MGAIEHLRDDSIGIERVVPPEELVHVSNALAGSQEVIDLAQSVNARVSVHPDDDLGNLRGAATHPVIARAPKLH